MDALAKKFVTVAEASLVLGISRVHLYRSIERGEIPAIRIGGVIRIPLRWLDLLDSAGSSAGAGG